MTSLFRHRVSRCPRRFVSKNLVRKPLVPVILTTSGSWALFRKSALDWIDHTGSAVLRKPGSGTGKPATASACAVCRCKTIFTFVGFKTSVKFNVSKTLIIKRNKFCRTRSLSNATFSFLITWRSSSSKSAAVYKISLKADDFSLRYGDIMIFKMAAVRHLGIVLPPYETTHEVCCWPQLPDKFHVNLIHTSEDISIWIFRIFGLKCLLRPLKWGFWGNLDP